MIGWLKGSIAKIEENSILLNVNGVGYELLCSSRTCADSTLGSQQEFWVHTQMREDALYLIGFQSQAEKKLFHALLKVNGVGPKLALGILSGGTVSQITSIIQRSDIKALTAMPKVGKKTAEQIILALKGSSILDAKSELLVGNESLSQIQSALLNLGFKQNLVQSFISTLPSDIEFDEGVREGLKTLHAAEKG